MAVTATVTRHHERLVLDAGRLGFRQFPYGITVSLKQRSQRRSSPDAHTSSARAPQAEQRNTVGPFGIALAGTALRSDPGRLIWTGPDGDGE